MLKLISCFLDLHQHQQSSQLQREKKSSTSVNIYVTRVGVNVDRWRHCSTQLITCALIEFIKLKLNS